MISPAFQKAERKRRSAELSHRPRFATAREIRDLRDLAHWVKVEVPRVVFAADVTAATRELNKHLQHLRQPPLGEMG